MQLSHYQLQLCKIQAKAFALAYARGFDPHLFVSGFMRSETAAALDAAFDPMQWAGEVALVNEVVLSASLTASDSVSVVSAEALFWAGYLYRYWHFLTGESSAEIYDQASFGTVLDVYPGLHALSVEMAVERLKEMSKTNGVSRSMNPHTLKLAADFSLKNAMTDFIAQRNQMLSVVGENNPAECVSDLKSEIDICRQTMLKYKGQLEQIDALIKPFIRRCVDDGLEKSGEIRLYLTSVSNEMLTLTSGDLGLTILLYLSGDPSCPIKTISAIATSGVKSKKFTSS